MCLSVPGKVVEIQNNMARVEVGGVIRDVSMDVCPDVVVGEYVLIHTGFAIQKLDEKEALETLDLLRKMAEIQ
ncbi:MAG: HypC/HybG/HupF family hydrogenase formation chaperone [Desulfobacteraceae bacterium]|nr:MAG: HypC/HybG/HupF family hydrogenase formation chaperone [Desulfobacteraceae bacterium]